MASSDSSGPFVSAAPGFDTTRWSIVVAAADRQSPNASAALEKLCRAYWYPLFCYARRRGLSPADAQDLTQEFFCRLIARNSLETVDRSRGSFRSFLLASINHLLANEWDKARTLKRGGHVQFLSLDVEEAESRFIHELQNQGSPEKAFDQRWAVTLLDRALARLREESIAADRLASFEALKRFLSDTAGAGDYAELEAQLDLEAGGAAVAVHRLRVRYREIVRAEIAETVSGEDELKVEMRHLFASLS